MSMEKASGQESRASFSDLVFSGSNLVFGQKLPQNVFNLHPTPLQIKEEEKTAKLFEMVKTNISRLDS